MQVGSPIGGDADDDQAHSLMEMGVSLGREGLTLFGPILLPGLINSMAATRVRPAIVEEEGAPRRVSGKMAGTTWAGAGGGSRSRARAPRRG